MPAVARVIAYLLGLALLWGGIGILASEIIVVLLVHVGETQWNELSLGRDLMRAMPFLGAGTKEMLISGCIAAAAVACGIAMSRAAHRADPVRLEGP